MNPFYLSLREAAQRCELVESISHNFSPTQRQLKSMREYFGSKLDDIAASGVEFLRSQLRTGQQSESKVFYEMWKTFLGNPDIALWAKTEGERQWLEPRTFFVPLVAYIRDYARERGVVKQIGPELLLVENS